MFAYEDLIELLEETGLLDRASENLRYRRDHRRRRAGRRMERPELAILEAYASGRSPARWRRRLRGRPVGSGARPAQLLPRRGRRALRPPASRAPAAHAAGLHMINANAVVNALGPTFVSQLVAEQVGRCGGRRTRVSDRGRGDGADEPWEAIEGLEDVERSTQMQLLGGVDALVEATARWYLMYAPGAPFEEWSPSPATGSCGSRRCSATSGPRSARRRRDETNERLTGEGVSPGIARPRPPRGARPRAGRRHRGHRDRPLDRGRRACVLHDRRRQARLDGSASSSACGPRRGCSGGRCRRCARTALRPPRPRRGGPAREPRRRAAGRGRGVPARTHSARPRAWSRSSRALAREGESDLAGLALAVRQLGGLVS